MIKTGKYLSEIFAMQKMQENFLHKFRMFFSTILIEPNCVAYTNQHGDIMIDVETERKYVSNTNLDLTQLSIFSHRFMSIAEQMGR